MVVDKEDLWPESFGSLEIETPLEILRKQASLLSSKTGNLLVGNVGKTTTAGGNFFLSLYLVAPALDNYRYKLLSVQHGINLYPVSTWGEVPDKEFKNPKEFKGYLRSKFVEDATLNIIQSLMVQSRSE